MAVVVIPTAKEIYSCYYDEGRLNYREEPYFRLKLPRLTIISAVNFEKKQKKRERKRRRRRRGMKLADKNISCQSKQSVNAFSPTNKIQLLLLLHEIQIAPQMSNSSL